MNAARNGVERLHRSVGWSVISNQNKSKDDNEEPAGHKNCSSCRKAYGICKNVTLLLFFFETLSMEKPIYGPRMT